MMLAVKNLMPIVVGPRPWLRQIRPWEIMIWQILRTVKNLHLEGHRQKETRRWPQSWTRIWIKMLAQHRESQQGCWEAQSPIGRVNHKPSLNQSKQAEAWNNLWNLKLRANPIRPMRRLLWWWIPENKHQLQSRNKWYTPTLRKVEWCQNSMQPIRIWQ